MLAAARAAIVVVATWLALTVLLVLLESLLPGPSPHGTPSSTAVMLWLLALLLVPPVTCVALRRWISAGRAGSADQPLPPAPYAGAEQDAPQSGGPAWHATASPAPPSDAQRTIQPPRAPEDPDVWALRQARAEAERARAEAESKRAEAEKARKEEARRRSARNRRFRQTGRRY
ncbi:hypothetical protein [Streptacidiphilus sp. MAP5-52]|uniref:hypothetical protein n=1 Tax=Streptacidiphilus sp. MAP5-52 TaxID=3156267 RepID=UPI0035127949